MWPKQFTQLIQVKHIEGKNWQNRTLWSLQKVVWLVLDSGNSWLLLQSTVGNTTSEEESQSKCCGKNISRMYIFGFVEKRERDNMISQLFFLLFLFLASFNWSWFESFILFSLLVLDIFFLLLTFTVVGSTQCYKFCKKVPY